MKLKICSQLPEQLDSKYIYELEPVDSNDNYYRERTDRNIGWITSDEQSLLKKKTVGISGCGGMGGMLAQILIRAGVGNIKIADNSEFDESNINRQFGATRSNVGVSKAQATANSIRAVTDDNSIKVYPTGICENTVDDFLEDCDVVCDEIEFWAVAARILLHQKARKKGLPLFNANTIGFGTRLFLFTPDSGTMEECLGMSYEQAKILENKIESNTATAEEIDYVMRAVFRGLLPEIPIYSDDSEACGNMKTLERRLFTEGKAPIIATNPPMATGFLANHTLLYLLKDSGVKRNIKLPPEMPGYLYFDAAFMEAKSIDKKWW
jgi:molybdopterin/thiamine biosynthesis adenylyltransferase